MLDQTSPDLPPRKFTLLLAIKKLPWNVFAIVLLIHLAVIWWLFGAYFGRSSDSLAEPIFVTLEVFEALPSEPLIQTSTDESEKADLDGNKTEGLR
jgi:hypothetical protein